MNRICRKFALLLLTALAAPVAYAQGVAPDALVKAVTLEVIELIRQDKDIQAGNAVKVAALVESKILPLFDFTHMTQLAAARSWPVATAAQKTALTAEFRTLLVRTYSTALSSYRDQVIDFKPLRAASGDTEVTVKTAIRQSGTAPLAMDYDMQNTEAGWQVYDIKIEGVSLVTTYRETFADMVRAGGVDGLIKSLSDKNRQSDARHHSGQAQEEHRLGPVLMRIVLQLGR